MNKSTKSISLVLIGSALFLSGCSAAREEEENDWDTASGGNVDDRPHHAGGIFMAPRLGGGGYGRGAVSSGASARSGFGSSSAHGVGS